jgi:hypothetical protein
MRSIERSSGNVSRMPSAVEDCVRTLLQMVHGTPLPVGEVVYSKWDGGQHLKVCSRSGLDGVAFDETEPFETRSYPHRPSPTERKAAELLLRTGRSGCRIRVDGIEACFAGNLDWSSFDDQQAPPEVSSSTADTAYCDDQDMKILLSELGRQARFARSLVRRKGLCMQADDLLQDTAHALCARLKKGLKVQNPSAFVRRILRNKAEDHARRALARPYGRNSRSLWSRRPRAHPGRRSGRAR